MAPIFELLKKDFTRGKVLLPGDAEYKESLKRWSATCIKPAAVVVQPGTAQEVSAAIRFANANGIRFTACCGGHSTSGQSSMSDGMVIDLRLMRSVSVDADKEIITFGGGCLWSDVDEVASQHGVATPGGTVNHTGVGGLILGGGFGWLSPRHGLTIDVLLEVEVVLADGSMVTASESEKPDLFWALRGAGTSFGVATKFTSRCFPQGDVWTGMLIYRPDRLQKVIEGCNAVLAKQDGNQAMLVALGFTPPQADQRMRMVGVHVFHNGTAEEGEKRYEPLLELEPMAKMVQTVPYKMVNGLPNHLYPHGGRYQFGAANVTYPVDAGVVQSAGDMFWEGIEKLSADPTKEDLRGSVLGLELFPMGKAREVAPEATAFANRGSYFNVALVMSWVSAESDKEVRGFKQRVAAFVRDAGFKGDSVGGKGVGQYNNYLESSISAEDAFGGNAKRLKELKQEYDPESRFDKLSRLA